MPSEQSPFVLFFYDFPNPLFLSLLFKRDNLFQIIKNEKGENGKSFKNLMYYEIYIIILIGFYLIVNSSQSYKKNIYCNFMAEI